MYDSVKKRIVYEYCTFDTILSLKHKINRNTLQVCQRSYASRTHTRARTQVYAYICVYIVACL